MQPKETTHRENQNTLFNSPRKDTFENYDFIYYSDKTMVNFNFSSVEFQFTIIAIIHIIARDGDDSAPDAYAIG